MKRRCDHSPPAQWFPRTSTHLQEILDTAQAVLDEAPRGLMECWGEGTVAIRAETLRKLTAVMRER